MFEFRHKLPQLISEFLRRDKQKKLSTDIAVPREKFLILYNFYKEKTKESKVPWVNFGHIGENHLHFNFLPTTDKAYRIAKKYIEEFVKKGVELGGTVSAEQVLER